MTNLHIIRNIKQRDSLIEIIKDQRPPFKVLIQDMNTIRSTPWNAFYWGVALRMIADYCGHDVDEVHEYLANKFRIEYYFDWKESKMVFERKSTTQDDLKEFEDYVEKVCAWSWLFLRLQIPHPNELINQDKVNEVKL
jgi:hypothetical protein